MQKRNGFAEVNGTSLYYEIAGSGYPLIFIHGFGFDTRMWTDQFETFAHYYKVICYDMAGFGKSAPPADKSYTDADDLKALLNYLGLSQAHIIGSSMGGGVAINFTLSYPEATHALILVDSALGGFQWSQELVSSVSLVWSKARESGIEAAKKLWLSLPLFEPALENPDLAPRLIKMVSDYSGWHLVNTIPERSSESKTIQQIGKISAPTLVLVGERDLQDFHMIANILKQQIPDAHKVILPGVGHMSNMEAPERFNEIVLNFLSGI